MDAPTMRNEAGSGTEHSKSIFDAALEIDRGGLFEVLGRAGDFSDAETEHDGLGDHLIVEDEVVGIFEQRERLKQFPRECPEAGVVFRELYAKKEF